MSELKSYGEWCDAIPAENEVAAGILRSWRESAYKLLTDNHKLEQENARLLSSRRWRKYPDEEPESLDNDFQLWSRTYGLVKASFRSLYCIPIVYNLHQKG